MKRRILYKFRSLETEQRRNHVRRMIVDRELFFSDPSTFNDPYDCNIGLHLRGRLRPFSVLSFSTEDCDMISLLSKIAFQKIHILDSRKRESSRILGPSPQFALFRAIDGRKTNFHHVPILDSILTFQKRRRGNLDFKTRKSCPKPQ
jgi:hypothetical protein